MLLVVIVIHGFLSDSTTAASGISTSAIHPLPLRNKVFIVEGRGFIHIF
jgi:hypothetical protein